MDYSFFFYRCSPSNTPVNTTGVVELGWLGSRIEEVEDIGRGTRQKLGLSPWRPEASRLQRVTLDSLLFAMANQQPWCTAQLLFCCEVV